MLWLFGHSDLRRRLALALTLGATAPWAQQSNRTGSFLNLEKGRPVLTRSFGDTLGGSARPLSLANADFDEDGMPDLASGYATGAGAGAIVIHRGNVDALWPYGNALRNGEPPAFLPDARVVAIPEEPDFLGAGDFDADGHWDIVAAHLGSSSLWLLRGNGHGGFYPAERISLPGGVTALVTGELNRPDGLTDIAVAVSGSRPGNVAQVLVFEAPGGALRGDPEVFPLRSAASALAVADLDGDLWNDLAIGAGKELLIVHSRDRKLALSKTIGSHAEPARVTRQSLPFAVQSLAAGSFASHQWLQLAALGDDGKVHMLERAGARDALTASMAIPGPDGRIRTAPGAPLPTASTVRPAPSKDLADLVLRGEIQVPGMASVTGALPQLVAARVSAGGTRDLIVVHGAARKLHVISRDRDSAEPAVRLAASLDTPNAPMAIMPMRLHPHPLQDLVMLEDGQAEPRVVPQTNVTTFIVTNTNDSGAGSLREAINGSTQTHGASSITFNIPTSDPNRDPHTGVFTITPIGVLNGYNNVINAEPLLGGPAVTIDGYTQPGSSPNTLVNGDNAVILIRIDGAQGGQGSVGLQTFPGTTDTIRGLQVTGFNDPKPNVPQNTESGGTGIEVDGGNDFVEGNFIGTDSTGTTPLLNSNGVIAFGSGDGNTIGGTTPQARNLISGNGSGTGDAFQSNPNTYFIQGNYIGTDATGTKALPNGQGAGGAGVNTVIGGTVAGAGNLISSNNSYNVYSITIASNQFGSQYIVQGNLIGTDYTGSNAIGNLSAGVEVGSINHTGNQYPTAVANTIGGTTPAARNIVSGNSLGGIYITDGADSTLVQGNYIGVDVSGAKALGNGTFAGADGIFNGIISSSSNSTAPANTAIGGEFSGAGNVISGNAANGIQIVGLGGAVRNQSLVTFGNAVEGNYIGTDATGVNPLPNQANGVYVNTGGGLNLIGDPGGASGNIIAFNALNGVLVDPGTPSAQIGTGNSVTGNTIFSNGGAGVHMPSGLNSPISRNSIYSNGMLGADTAISGPNAQAACAPSSAAPTLLQNAPVLTSASGTAIITATATDPNGNTSEFSQCALLTPTNNVIDVTGALTATEPGVTYTVELFQNTSCDPSGYGQGKQYLTKVSVTTRSTCAAPISLPIDLSKADLSVTLSPPTYGTQGVPAGYSYTMSSVVSNLGAANATNVVYTATLPSGFSFAASTTTKGTCANASGTVTCNIGSLASGATVNITINALITTSTAGNQITAVSVTGGQTDPNLANNSASLTVGVVIPFPGISSFNPGYVLTGSPNSTITVTGSGFYPGSVVSFNNVNIANVTFVNSTTLNMVVPASLLTTYGTFPVTVSNGTGQFQTSTPANFWVRTPCSFALSTSSVALGADGAQNLSFTVTAPADCSWEVYNPGFYPYSATQTASATDIYGDEFGSGSATYSVNANTGAPSIYTISILPTELEACGFTGANCGPPLGQAATFTIYQGGAFTCTYSLSASSVNAPVGGVVGIGFNGGGTGSGTFYVNVSNPSCIPTATTNVPWITQEGQGGNTNQWEEDYNVSANATGAARSGAVVMTGLQSVTGNTPNIATLNFTVNQAGPTSYSLCDVNQDTFVNVMDVQRTINEALGTALAGNDLNADGKVNVADIQIAINAVLNLGCSAS